MTLFLFPACANRRHDGESAGGSPDSGISREKGTLDVQSHEGLAKMGQATRDCIMEELHPSA